MLTEAALLVSLSVTHGQGTSDCATHAQLSSAVERRLKRRVFVPAEQAALRVDVAFSKRGPDIEAKILLADKDGRSRGTRSLNTSAHCSALDDSLALSVALLVDEPPEAPPEPADSAANAPAAAAPAAPRRAPTSLTIPADVAAPREPWHALVGAAAGAAWGPLPQVRPAVVLQVQILPRDFVPILLQAEGFWPSDAARDASSGAHFRLLRAGLALCPRLLSTPENSLGFCAGQKLGWLDVEGYGFDVDASDTRLGLSLSLGAEARQVLWKPLALRAYLGGEIPLVRDRFTSAGSNAVELFQPSPLTLAGEIGVEVALW